MPKFTPGPWKVDGSHVYSPDGKIIAVIHNPGSKMSDYPLIPNRNLIAAAPEMYDLIFHYPDQSTIDWLRKVRELLKKINGEAP